MLDGAILQNAYGMNPQSVAKTSLGTDGIKEFKTITDLFSADYGLVMGAQITMVSKGGTNQFHGDAYEFYGTATWMPRITSTRELSRISRGTSSEGLSAARSKKDRTFFWGVYEGLRETLGLTELILCLPQLVMVQQRRNLERPRHPTPWILRTTMHQLGTSLSGPGVVGRTG